MQREKVDCQEYINSPKWKAKRELYFKRSRGHGCFCCSAEIKPNFHLHHRTYKRLGNERWQDLVVVCPECHWLIHAVQQQAKITGNSRCTHVWGATEKVRRMTRRLRRPYGFKGHMKKHR